MEIKRIEPIAISLPMKKPVFMAGVEIRQADNVLVRIEADNGVVGWGEPAASERPNRSAAPPTDRPTRSSATSAEAASRCSASSATASLPPTCVTPAR